jgi:hypothetical protein
VDKLSFSNIRLFINILLSNLIMVLFGSQEVNFNKRHYGKTLRKSL